MRARRLSILGILLMASLACGGGSSSPSAPPPPATVTGQWNGTFTITGVNPTNHCVAQFYVSRAGVPFDAQVTMNQSGSNVTGTAVLAGVQTCDFNGTLNGQRFSATVTSCQTEVVTVTCASGLNYEVRTVSGSSTIEGTFNAARTTFDGTERSEARAVRGNETFDLALIGSLRLTKV